MAFQINGGNVKFYVNTNSSGSIAQEGETASGTKLVSFLPTNAEAILDKNETEESPQAVYDAVNLFVTNVLKTTFLPTTMYIPITLNYTADSLAKMKQRSEQNGNEQSGT